MVDRVPWSDCPKDIILAIAKRVDSCTDDILRLRSVCTSWRSSVPSPFHKSHPFLAKLPFPISPYDSIDPDRCYFALTEMITYRLEPLNTASNSSGSPKGWLVTVEEGEQGKMLILNPLALFQDPQLPETFPKVLNLLDFKVSVISRAYDLHHVDSSPIPNNFDEDPLLFVSKTVVSFVSHQTSINDLAVLALKNSGNLGLFKPGDEEWTISEYPLTCFDDIINYKGRFYVVDQSGKLEMLDSSLVGMEIVPALTVSGNRKHLVESSGDLLLVDRYIENEDNLLISNDVVGFDEDPDKNFTYHIEVFKLNEQEHCWVKVENLHDKVLFLGDQQCFSISSQDFHGGNGNCVYFRDTHVGLPTRDYALPKELYGHDTWVFALGGGGLGPLDNFPGYADIYWPPQTY